MLFLFTLLFVGSTYAQVTIPGSKCPALSVKSDFDVQKYVGRWFEQRRYFIVIEAGLKCITATYTANDNGTINVQSQGIHPFTGKQTSITGLAYAETAEKAKLSLILPQVLPYIPVQAKGSYWILDTDYTSYSVEWSCVDLGFTSARFMWILTRERQASADILGKAYNVLDKYKINKWLLIKTDQTNCPEN